MNWHLNMADESIRDVIYWPEDASLNSIEKVRGGNPILFPFCARTFDRGTIHKWRSKDGETRDMPMHGFARDHSFAIQNIDEYGFTWKSEQFISPKLPKIYIEVTKKPSS